MDKYAVVGNPVEHSLSPFIHGEFAKQTQEDISYIKIKAPLNEFEKTIREFQTSGGKGVNITLPFKMQAYQMADEQSELAKQSKAANTFLFRKDGTIYADNTDGPGLVQDLKHNHNYSFRQKKILILGAGGAAHTILPSILQLAPSKIVIANRTKDKAVEMADLYKMQGDLDGIGLDELKNDPYDLIINCTSVGLTDEFFSLPDGLINKYTWCYDLMYGKKKSGFLEWCKKLNAEECLDGLGMLVEQAAASFYIWRGIYPDTRSVLEKLKETQMSIL